MLDDKILSASDGVHDLLAGLAGIPSREAFPFLLKARAGGTLLFQASSLFDCGIHAANHQQRNGGKHRGTCHGQHTSTSAHIMYETCNGFKDSASPDHSGGL